MPERSAFLDVVTIWSIIMRFSEPDDPAELLLALILIDFLLVIIAALQLRQTVVRGREAERYENFAVTIYLLLTLDALASDCKALAAHRGWAA